MELTIEKVTSLRINIYILWLVLLSAECLQAQSGRAFVGYSYQRRVSSADGVAASVGFDVSRSVALVIGAGFNASSTAIPGTIINSTAHFISYHAGPEYFLNIGRLRPFAHLLIGGGHETEKLSTSTASATEDGNLIEILPGGGLDVGVARHLAVRLVQVDYRRDVAEKFAGRSRASTNGWRYSGGVVFRF